MNRSKKPLVGIIMGSDSDLEVMMEAAKVLDEFQVGYEMKVASAHRSPGFTRNFVEGALKRGIRVIIAGAGAAAHLAGVTAAHFPLPVIGVPIYTKSLGGLDSLLSTVQMPGGIPVASVAIGGAKNAGLLAVQILAAGNNALLEKMIAYKKKMESDVIRKNKKLNL